MEKTPQSEALGRKLAEARKAKKLTQRQLGEQVGITFGEISTYERGIKVPGFLKGLTLCEALDLNPAKLTLAIKEAADAGTPQTTAEATDE